MADHLGLHRRAFQYYGPQEQMARVSACCRCDPSRHCGKVRIGRSGVCTHTKYFVMEGIQRSLPHPPACVTRVAHRVLLHGPEVSIRDLASSVRTVIHSAIIVSGGAPDIGGLERVGRLAVRVR